MGHCHGFPQLQQVQYIELVYRAREICLWKSFYSPSLEEDALWPTMHTFMISKLALFYWQTLYNLLYKPLIWGGKEMKKHLSTSRECRYSTLVGHSKEMGCKREMCTPQTGWEISYLPTDSERDKNSLWLTFNQFARQYAPKLNQAVISTISQLKTIKSFAEKQASEQE